MWEVMGILNAFSFPGAGGATLYPSIYPVNAFRVLFNAYFGTNLDLLEDQSYFAVEDRPYGFENVTSRAQSE
jgi:hypothetical protein